MNSKNILNLAALTLAIGGSACNLPKTLKSENPDPKTLTCEQIRAKLEEEVSKPIFMGKVIVPIMGPVLKEQEQEAYQKTLQDKKCK